MGTSFSDIYSMLLYRTKKRVRTGLTWTIFIVLLVTYLGIQANRPDRSGSKLPILVERTMGDWIRSWSKGFYEEYWSKPAISPYATREHGSFYSALEYVTFDPRRSERIELEHAFSQAVEQSVRGKVNRLNELTRLVEVQSIIGDPTAREIEGAPSSRFNLDYLLGEVRFLKNFTLVRFTSKVKKLKKKQGKFKPKKGKKKKKKTGEDWFGKKGKRVYDFGDKLEINSDFYRKLRNDPGHVVAHRDGQVYYSVVVNDFANENPIGLLIASFQPSGFVDLQAFYLPAIDIDYHLGSYTSKDKDVLAYKGRPELFNKNKGIDLLPADPGVHELLTEAGKVPHLLFEKFHPYGFKLRSFYEARSIAYFVARIGGILLLLFGIYFLYLLGRQLNQYWQENPIQMPTSSAPVMENLRASIANTDKTLELTNQTLDALADSLKNPAPVDVNLGSSFRAIFENLERVVENQNYLYERIEGKSTAKPAQLTADYEAIKEQAPDSIKEDAVENNDDEEELIFIPEQTHPSVVEITLDEEYDEWTGPTLVINDQGVPVPAEKAEMEPAPAPENEEPSATSQEDDDEPSSEASLQEPEPDPDPIVSQEETDEGIVIADYQGESQKIPTSDDLAKPEVAATVSTEDFGDPEQEIEAMPLFLPVEDDDASFAIEHRDPISMPKNDAELPEQDTFAKVETGPVGKPEPVAELLEKEEELTRLEENKELPMLDEEPALDNELAPLDADEADLAQTPLDDDPGLTTEVNQDVVFVQGGDDDPLDFFDVSWDNTPGSELEEPEAGSSEPVPEPENDATSREPKVDVDDEPSEEQVASVDSEKATAKAPSETRSRPPRLFDSLVFRDPNAKIEADLMGDTQADPKPIATDDEDFMEIDILADSDLDFEVLPEGAVEPYQNLRDRILEIPDNGQESRYMVFEENLDSMEVDSLGQDKAPQTVDPTLVPV